jgi:LPXTG-motif cell wall-anchored protein
MDTLTTTNWLLVILILSVLFTGGAGLYRRRV